MKFPRILLFVATLLVGIAIGVGLTYGFDQGLERFLEPIVAFFYEPKLYLVPVDFNPFPDELEI